MTGASFAPSPNLFFETLTAHVRTEAVQAALEMDLFTAIGEGAQTVEAIAARCAASPKGIRVLCDYLTILGFLNKVDNNYELTMDSAAFLDRRSAYFMGSVVDFMLNPMLTDKFKNLARVVRQGGALDEGTLAPEHPVWVKFARAMSPMMALPANLIAQLAGAAHGQPCKALDIAAGHGIFGITIARMNPRAEIVAQDWPNVLEVAKENARNAGVENRYRTLAGSAFEVDYGSDYDLVLLTNFLHHFDVASCEKLLRKIHAALKDGGRVMTLELVPNADRVTPPSAASFSMIMLASTPSGDAYTFAEYQSMFANAGFKNSELHPVTPTPHSVIVSHR
jgi:2-polyprenyl-3-methyl-5-hydroxy-6-metoxy-1,4-benzoquinol methylase